MVFGGAPFGAAPFGGTWLVGPLLAHQEVDLTPDAAAATMAVVELYAPHVAPPKPWRPGRLDAGAQSRVLWLMGVAGFAALIGQVIDGTEGELIGLVVGIAWARWCAPD